MEAEVVRICCCGGGAGGYRTSDQTNPAQGTALTITVGAGGASGGTTGYGAIGAQSQISGTGLTTITTAPGSGGAKDGVHAYNAGTFASGGGGGSFTGEGATPTASPAGQGRKGGTGISSYIPALKGVAEEEVAVMQLLAEMPREIPQELAEQELKLIL